MTLFDSRVPIFCWGIAISCVFGFVFGAELSSVGFTEAREYELQEEVSLAGTVTAVTRSQLAVEVEGLVTVVFVREGDSVKKGEVLLTLRQDGIALEIQALEAELQEAQSRLALSKQQLKRMRELLTQKVYSQQQVDEGTHEVFAWEGRVLQLESKKRQLHLDLKRASLRTPFGGTVIAKHAEVGQWLERGETAFELFDPSLLEVTVNLPERYIDKVVQGSPVKVSFDALPRLSVEGQIEAVVPFADEVSRTFPVKISFKNEDGRIPAGVLARVSFLAGRSHRGLIIPKDAIVNRGETQMIFLLDEKDAVQIVSVRTGIGKGDWIEIFGNLSAGQRVVTLGNERLESGQRVLGQIRDYDLP